jgi:hypothetical protein
MCYALCINHYNYEQRIINTGVSGFNGFLTYLTVLSIFLGYSVFGVQGVFAGPLVLVLGTLVFQSLDSLANSSEVRVDTQHTHLVLTLKQVLACRICVCV